MSSPDPWYALRYFSRHLALLIPSYLATLIQEVALIHCYILQPFWIHNFTSCNFGHSIAIPQYGLKYSHLSLSLSVWSYFKLILWIISTPNTLSVTKVSYYLLAKH